MAVGYTLANTQYGAGGLRQVFLPELQRLVDDGVLTVLERRRMENLDARIGPRWRRRDDSGKDGRP